MPRQLLAQVLLWLPVFPRHIPQRPFVHETPFEHNFRLGWLKWEIFKTFKIKRPGWNFVVLVLNTAGSGLLVYSNLHQPTNSHIQNLFVINNRWVFGIVHRQKAHVHPYTKNIDCCTSVMFEKPTNTMLFVSILKNWRALVVCYASKVFVPNCFKWKTLTVSEPVAPLVSEPGR